MTNKDQLCNALAALLALVEMQDGKINELESRIGKLEKKSKSRPNLIKEK